MKKNILALITLGVALFSMALPLNMALAKGPTANGRAGITQVRGRSAANAGTLNRAEKSVKHQTKARVVTAQSADPCANDTPDDQEVNNGADTDTDNVNLQCGDQNGPDEQVESPSGSDTGAADTDNVQDETPGTDAPESPASVQSN